MCRILPLLFLFSSSIAWVRNASSAAASSGPRLFDAGSIQLDDSIDSTGDQIVLKVLYVSTARLSVSEAKAALQMLRITLEGSPEWIGHHDLSKKKKKNRTLPDRLLPKQWVQM